MQFAGVRFDCCCSLQDFLDAFYLFHFHFVSGFQSVAFHFLQIVHALFAKGNFDFGALHIILYVVDLALQLGFFDRADLHFLFQPVDQSLLLFNDLGFAVGLLVFLAVEAVNKRLSLVVVFAELCFAVSFLFLGLFELALCILQVARGLLDVFLVVVGGAELLACFLFGFRDFGLGDDEVAFGAFVEVPAPDDVVGPVEDLVYVVFAEGLDCTVVVGDVEGDDQFGEPVVFVEFLDDVVNHVFLDLHFSEFIHSF